MNVKNTLEHAYTYIIEHLSSVIDSVFFLSYSYRTTKFDLYKNSMFYITESSLYCDNNNQKKKCKQTRKYCYENKQHTPRFDVRSFNCTRLFKVFEAVCPFDVVELTCSSNA
jgi:hypothetical protein